MYQLLQSRGKNPWYPFNAEARWAPKVVWTFRRREKVSALFLSHLNRMSRKFWHQKLVGFAFGNVGY